MKIGIISDTHDYLSNVYTALDLLRDQSITTVLHCGDVCGPQVMQGLAEFDVWIAQGNMDRNLGLFTASALPLTRERLSWFHSLTFDGHSIALLHGDDIGLLNSLILSGRYSFVLHGHTHQRRDELFGSTRVINPGALGGTRRQNRSFCILDLEVGVPEFINIRSMYDL
ncbi:MAG: YfcE family phosphodiesterase [Chloroflexi bacterium]|nr:YfcE family phosphodiesterase [Chloroflexota bacterium]